jgi:glycosyltransferase involved in cell wall biosynthesis
MIEGRRPKVAHLTSVHATTDTRIVHKECATLACEGYDVVLIAPGPPSVLPANVRHHPVPLPRNRFERFTRTVPSVYRAATEEAADVYHFHDPELVFAGALLRARGARVIFDVHEDVPLDIQTKPWIPSPFRPLVSRAAAFVLRCVERLFTAVVSATPSIAKTFTHRNAIIVRNYPIRGEFSVQADPTPYSQRPMTALYLGSITALRGAEQMIQAMENPALPSDARLLMVGPFEDDALRARCASLEGWARVDAPGTLPRQALPSILGSARMGLLVFQPAPNHDNAMPTKFFEYLGVGLPVITSKLLTAFHEIVERYHCGILVDPRDSDEIAEAMKYLFEHPEEAQAMGERGKQAVTDGYEWSSEARALVTLYREIA